MTQPSSGRQGKGQAVTLPEGKAVPERIRLRLFDELPADKLELLQGLRPRTRGDCVDGPRPCPWVGCRYHLFLEVSRHGSIQLLHPELEPDELDDSCTLDVAERQGIACEDAAAALGLTRERARQIEVDALEKVDEHRDALRALYLDDGERLPAVRPTLRRPRINTCTCGQRHVWIKGNDCCEVCKRMKVSERRRSERAQHRVSERKRVARRVCPRCGQRMLFGARCSFTCEKAARRVA